MLGSIREVRERKIEGQDDGERDEVPPGGRVSTRDDDFEKGEDGVEGVLGGVAPKVVGGGEVGGGKDGPIDNCQDD